MKRKWTDEDIAMWCEENLFGDRYVPGAGRIPLTPTQEAIKNIAVEIIKKWEAR